MKKLNFLTRKLIQCTLVGICLMGTSARAEMFFRGQAYALLNYGAQDSGSDVSSVIAHIGIAESNGQWVSVQDIGLERKSDGHFFGKTQLVIPNYNEGSSVKPRGAQVAYKVTLASGEIFWKGPFPINETQHLHVYTGEGCSGIFNNSGHQHDTDGECENTPAIQNIVSTYNNSQDAGETSVAVIEFYEGT